MNRGSDEEGRGSTDRLSRMNHHLRTMARKASSSWKRSRPDASSEHEDDELHRQRVALLSNSALHAGGGVVTSNADHGESVWLEDDLGSSLLPASSATNGPPLTIGSFQFRHPLLHPDNRRTALRLLRQLGDYLAYLTLLTMLVVIPLVLYRALSNRKVDLAAWNSAGVMACGTVVLSFRQVYLHLTHWYMPEVQKYVVRILWMVPIYSVQSWLSLRYHHSRIYIDTIRDLYEAYVIASFVYYLIALLGGQDALVQILLHKRDTATSLGQHPFPLRLLLPRWELGMEFLLQCKHGVLQYVVFKIGSTFLTYFFEMTGLYCEGTFSWKVAYPYLCFFQNISVMYALYSLVMLYSAVKEELEYPVDWKPLYKFLCIKGVVFFTWWQGVIIFYLRAHGIIGNVGDWSSKDVAYGLIDYCIVIEMVGFAIAHSYTFTYKEYLPGGLPTADSLCQEQSRLTSNGGVDPDDGEESNTWPDPSQQRSHLADSGAPSAGQVHRSASYRPPATLEQPMKFRDALWSSTLPRETIEDIQRLRRSGFDKGSAFLHHNYSRGEDDDGCQESGHEQEISLPQIEGSDLRLTAEEEVNDDGGDGDDVDTDATTQAGSPEAEAELQAEHSIRELDVGATESTPADVDRLARV